MSNLVKVKSISATISNNYGEAIYTMDLSNCYIISILTNDVYGSVLGYSISSNTIHMRIFSIAGTPFVFISKGTVVPLNIWYIKY